MLRQVAGVLLLLYLARSSQSGTEIESLSGSQEELDTKLILYSVTATQRGATSIRFTLHQIQTTSY